MQIQPLFVSGFSQFHNRIYFPAKSGFFQKKEEYFIFFNA